MSGVGKSSSNKASSALRSSKARSRDKALTSGRPPLLSSSKSKPASALNPQRSSLSSKRTRTLIRAHHVLQKRLARARAENDMEQIQDLEAQLAASGGLETYQLASTVGQSAERGGDSSRVLVDWLRPEIEARRRGRKKDSTLAASSPPSSLAHGASPPLTPPPLPLRILEIGALSTTNALNMPRLTSVRRIDLRSSGPGIEEADFMTFPLPDSPDGSGEWEGRRGYDVISLSLVLNYVPDARGRGDMLRRTTMFFSRGHEHEQVDEDFGEHVVMHTEPRSDGQQDNGTDEDEDEDEGEQATQRHPRKRGDDQRQSRRLLPCLFLVLPAPTLLNSRYITPDHLADMLSSLGYSDLEAKTTRKLHYSLWRFDPKRRDEWIAQGGKTVFKKKELNPGSGRNNFCIVLDDPDKG
ncbi:hypothetical protein A1O3_08272 [Capronia epimyces CBS 606.96]|uniref:25S rRNA adenine-N(1) methyltransferase n=1 Tax=Capronia epimyces CBS 606.96 TaxID=1182542 RepID=W9XSN6_9EURO|nr:uncharacterized protein A1O3_08272 [Capronia epimyces CBS 606.96]EXJ79986.1 hypothetical protein A1O3_08272 [Capronia epimyces CBS 606.96]